MTLEWRRPFCPLCEAELVAKRADLVAEPSSSSSSAPAVFVARVPCAKHRALYEAALEGERVFERFKKGSA